MQTKEIFLPLKQYKYKRKRSPAPEEKKKGFNKLRIQMTKSLKKMMKKKN